jgi:thiamine-monophosphate kinase
MALFDPDDMPSWLERKFTYSNDKIIAGINEDDCGIIEFGNQILVVTTDYLNARPIVLELSLGNYWDVGRLLVAANLSDLCGTGAIPEALLISVMLEKGIESDSYYALMEGVKFESDKASIPVIGGDTKIGKSNAFSCTAIGSALTRKNLFLKNGAKIGDLIWVSGYIGSNSAAVFGLSSGFSDKSWRQWASRTIIEPRLPLSKSKNISLLEIGNGGIDISDGLGADAYRMAKASNVGIMIYPERIPVEDQTLQVARHYGFPSWTFAFAVGGDFQFIVTTDQDEITYKKMTTQSMICIGEVVKEPIHQIRLSDDSIHPMPTIGHRDAKDLSFSDEVAELIRKFNITRGQE